MIDPIERQAAIDLVRDVCDAIMSGCESYYDPETEDEIYKDILEVDAILKCNKEVRIALLNMPSAQKTGTWIESEVVPVRKAGFDEVQIARCSACGRYHTTPYSYFFREDNFCPHCGAKMEEDK